jgi:hypothetical protein
MCPHCRQEAPIRYQGVAAFCSACGKPRAPLMAPSVSYAGKPSKVGGTVARVIGWLVLTFGLSTALGLGLLLGSLVSVWLGLALGLPIGIVSTVVGTMLVLSGGKLRNEGDAKQRETRRQAVFALARNRRGAVTADEAARAMGVSPAEADAFLTDLAKTISEEVTVEIDDRGGIYYAFPRLLPETKQRFEEPRMRVDGAQDPSGDALAEEEAAQREAVRRKQGR